MKVKRTVLMFLLVAGFIGCGKQQPRHIVILPDVSGSIDRKALAQAFKAIDGLVGHLHRGDKIAIIPILGDAQAEASGRIIRFEVPINRQAYDSDLRSFRTRLKASLDEMKTTAVGHPGSKTDILGSIALASQEFQTDSGNLSNQLMILSDFIQEDREIDFRRDKRLADWMTAREFATFIAKRDNVNFKGTTIYLGLLRSNEYVHSSHSRREALQEFWPEYFRAAGAKPRFVADGPGLLESAEQATRL